MPPPDAIDSIKDERIVTARALVTRAGRRATGRCLLAGPSLIAQAVAAGATVEYVLHAAGATDRALAGTLAAAGIPAVPVRSGLLRKVTGGAKPVDWLAVARLPAEASPGAPYGDFAVVCERVADPGNLGTIVRTARALGVRDVVLTDDGTDLGTHRVLDAARGAVLGARVRRFPDPPSALAALRAAGFQLAVTSPHGSQLQALAPLRKGRLALVVGNETAGVSADTLAAADLVVQIPMAGAVESLNVGVATGISIYELRMRMVLAMLTDRIRDTLGRELNLAGRFVRTALDARLREVGDLDSNQVVALMVVACERGTARADLCRDLGLTPDELAAALAPLIDRGYLAGAGATVEIRPGGEQALAALWTVQERVEDELYAGFSEQERDQFRRLLGRLRANAQRLSGS